MISAALLSPDRMKTLDLFQYMRHLDANGQSAQKYEIQFWKKVFYPLSCLVMVVLALPFAYLHFRSGQIAGHVCLTKCRRDCNCRQVPSYLPLKRQIIASLHKCRIR